MFILGYFISIIIGVLLGLIGGGGSILTLPTLVYLFDITPSTATTYSLFIVGITSLVGIRPKFIKKEISWSTGILFGIPSVISVILTRSLILPAIPNDIISLGELLITKDLVLMLLFAVIMLMAAFSMIKKSKPRNSTHMSLMKKSFYIIMEGGVVGIITGLVGAGGGFLIIPALVLLTGLSIRVAIGTSLLIIAIKSLLGFFADGQINSVNRLLLTTISVIAIIGMIVGTYAQKYIKETSLKKGFGYFTLIMAIIILIKELLFTSP